MIDAIVADERGVEIRGIASSGIGRYGGGGLPVSKSKPDSHKEEEIHPLEKIVEEAVEGATKINYERAKKKSKEADAELVAIKKVKQNVAELLKDQHVEEDPQVEDEKLEKYVQNLLRKKNED